MGRLMAIGGVLLAFALGVIAGGGTAGGEAPTRPSKAIRELQDKVIDLGQRMTVIEQQLGCSSLLLECIGTDPSIKERVEELEFRADHPELETG